MTLQHLGATCWFYFSLSNQSTFTLFRPSQEIIPTLVAVDLPALLSLSSSSWQGLTVFTSHVPSYVWLWMLMHRRRKKREEHQEYNGNYQVFFLVSSSGVMYHGWFEDLSQEKEWIWGKKGWKGDETAKSIRMVYKLYIHTNTSTQIYTYTYV